MKSQAVIITILIYLATQIPDICAQSEDNKNEFIKINNNFSNSVEIFLPFLEKSPIIDGDLIDWKHYAFHDGVWDIYRVQNSSWYNPLRNRLTDHGDEPPPEDDLKARYYMAWDNSFIYMGAEVTDNRNDVTDPQNQPHRWYYKDCICWFWEAPYDTISESFGQGDNAFCFVIDSMYPENGSWWRHGTALKRYVEEPIPSEAVSFVIKMNPCRHNQGDFILEARVNLSMTFSMSDPTYKPPKIGDIYRLQIVHTDPDGGDYGGHLLIYGEGDNDNTWHKVTLTGSKKPYERKIK